MTYERVFSSYEFHACNFLPTYTAKVVLFLLQKVNIIYYLTGSFIYFSHTKENYALFSLKISFYFSIHTQRPDLHWKLLLEFHDVALILEMLALQIQI